MGGFCCTEMSMRILFVALGLAALGLAAPMINDQGFVDQINNQSGILWTAGFNQRFNSLPLSAMKSLCGVTPESWGKVQAIPRENSSIPVAAIPDEFDSEKNWPKCAKVIGDIRDQSMCGCCWAFGGASAASDRLCISTDGAIAVPLSAQDICFCSSEDGCDGGQISTPWDYISSDGVVTGGQVDGTGPFGAGYCSEFSLPHCH